ncbi:MAG: hypothetical protein K9L64_05740, partial [Candidatus Izimaplasma sp.]|nr:hypothetical protein [Candidatus Izimaplasma bacterium]
MLTLVSGCDRIIKRAKSRKEIMSLKTEHMQERKTTKKEINKKSIKRKNESRKLKNRDMESLILAQDE